MTYDEEGKALGQGSGFFISEDGDIITNRHVMQSAYHAEVKTADGKVYEAERIVAEDKESDLIRLSVNIPGEATQVLKVTEVAPEVGERVIVVGSPLGFEQTVSDGIVSAVREIEGFGPIIQITAPISLGSSGSPVVNMQGEVIGIATFQMIEGQNLNFAIPGQMITKLNPTDSLTLSEWSEAKFEDWLESSDRLYLWGLFSYWDEEYEEALGYLEKAIEKNPQDAEAHSLMGDCYCELGRWYEAIAAYQKATNINSEDASSYGSLGWAYGEVGLWNKSIEASQKALNIDPTLAWVYSNMGWAYGVLGQHYQAIETLKKAVRLDPDYALAYYNLGWSYSELGLYSEAIKAYEQAIRRDPSCSDAYFGLGWIYTDLGLYEDAIEAYKKAISINPDDAIAHQNLGWVYDQLGFWNEAIRAYKQAIRIDPNFAEAHCNLGLDYMVIGDRKSALEEYRILKDLDQKMAQNLFGFIYSSNVGSTSSTVPQIQIGKIYYDVGSGHWISKVIDSGRYILLEDGSLWEVYSVDRITSMLWLPIDDITVIENGGLFPYKLINTDEGEVVEAKYLGNR
jgi:tetratricopeptide (TPR) repeat protein